MYLQYQYLRSGPIEKTRGSERYYNAGRPYELGGGRTLESHCITVVVDHVQGKDMGKKRYHI